MSLFHPDVQWDRVVKHCPHGLVIGLLCCNPITWKLAQICWQAFRAYEENEDRHTRDQAWNDYLGLLFGLATVAFIAIPVLAWVLVVLVKHILSIL